MPLNQKEIRDRAVEFSFRWGSAIREKSEAQTFWNEFFDIFGISRRRVAAFEVPVKKLGDKAGSIDLFWKGMLIVEHKSRGQNLDKAYQQALDYFPGITEQELPRYVLVSDFAKFRLYDLEADTEADLPLTELSGQIHRFGFMSGYTKRIYKDEDPVNVQVAEKMGELHDALLAGGYDGHKLEVFLVRLIYCLFADDTGIFPRDHFRFILEAKTREDGTDTGTLIAQIFQILDTPPEKREKTLDEDLEKFPYVNGALYEEVLRFPNFDSRMRRTLLECLTFDWSRVSPAIFGSMFQSVMDPVQRRNLGAHYTSERNILKIVRGLFLDDLYQEFESLKDNLRKLNQFHERLAQLRFFDPACGCGNFLIISYRELRRLEIAVLKQIRKLQDHRTETWHTDISLLSKIDVDAFSGIELEEFPVRIAEVALWLTDHQMNMELSAEFGQTYTRLPLKKSAHIVQGNALRMDWAALVPKPDASEKETTLFILGNPPFVGKYNRSAEQRWCLWLKDASPAEMRRLPEIMKRVEGVRIYRSESSRETTRKLADYPMLFGEVRQPQSDYVAIPLHSSEHRKYVPMGFFTKDHILNNSCSAVPDATLYHFGILTSAMHMAWMRQVCGRIKSDYRYSNSLVYNNFPWPEAPTPAQMKRVAQAAETVLAIRNDFPDSSLADLYDPDAMPKKLFDAHRALDAAVDLCYRSLLFKTELERLKFLFDLYLKYTEPLVREAAKSRRKRRKVRS